MFPDALASLVSLADNSVNLSLLIKQLKAQVGVVLFVGVGMSVFFRYPAWRAFLESQTTDAMVRQRIVDLLDCGQYEETAETLLETCGENAIQAAVEHAFARASATDTEWPCPVFAACPHALKDAACENRPWDKGVLAATCSFGAAAKHLNLAGRSLEYVS